MEEKDWPASFEKELRHAEAARSAGNEGKARVCARRAAGILARQVLLREGIQPQGSSALDFLKQLQNLALLDEQTRASAAFFLLHVDESKHLPADIDLLAQARWLRGRLFGK